MLVEISKNENHNCISKLIEIIITVIKSNVVITMFHIITTQTNQYIP